VPDTQRSPPAELYDKAPCGLMLADSKGQLVRVNQTICKWLGRSRAELLDARFPELLTVGGRIFYQTHLAPLLRMQGSVAEVKLELRAAHGKSIPVMVNLAEQLDGDELFLHIALFMAEDRHKYERELLLQRQRAEDLAAQYAKVQSDLAAAQTQAEDRAVFAEQMMGIVSHDLRNPLSTIHLSAVLLGMTDPSPQQLSALGRIDRAVKRAERLIRDLLGFTQARFGGGIPVKAELVDLHQVVAEAVQELSAAFPERKIVHERSGPGMCEADTDRIVQALGNLVANAVNYGRADVPIEVRTDGTSPEFLISVHNDGEPISEELRTTLFEPMVRGAVAGTKGVGLGLFIVREVAKAHKGSVQLASRAGEGTTFTIRIPKP
jgi:sigma-B regulation protein RsbU (phosphoserine phosphatase)